jgi:uncharacterized protein YqgV (UPF0045/DUF77 family)
VNKFLPEHRKMLGRFEVVDVADDAAAQLRARVSDDVALAVNWTWEYGSEVAELRNLYEKGKTAQWNAETDLDWSIPVTPDDWVLAPEASLLAQATKLMGKDEATQKQAAFDELNYLLSQLLHGEQAALQLCGQLVNVCDKMDQKWYAASQVIDEARHVEVLSKFLTRKMNGIYPIGGTLKYLLDQLLEAQGVQKKTLGMQTLFEGTAVGIMDLMRTMSRNAFVSEMIKRVEQDEARHAAFGVLTMRRVVKEATEAERNELEDWAFALLETLNANQQLDMLRVLGPKYGIDALSFMQIITSLPNFADLNSPIFMHTVVPNLQRLGLLTARTEAGWRRVGMMVDSRGGAPAGLLPLVA